MIAHSKQELGYKVFAGRKRLRRITTGAAFGLLTLAGTATPLSAQIIPAAKLSSVAPSLVAQGGREIRLTLVGSSFRRGARVVISPPLTDVSPIPFIFPPATDISVDSVAVVSSTLILAVINVRSDAEPGVRAVVVLNPVGTEFEPPTPQLLRVTLRTSLAAPLEIQTVVITHPRNGTVVSQGDVLYAEGILAGVGSGTVTGEWLWDGNVSEQFAVLMTGGERTTLRTARSLPTLNLGLHRLELRITSPNRLQSRPVEIVVNPGDWRLLRLLAPRYGAAAAADNPPLLRWTMVPGADKYQVGFTREPFYNTIERWHDVSDTQWRVPEEVWNDLPAGELYWTVRVVETSGETRKPAPLRPLWRLEAGALAPAAPAPTRTAAGTLLLEWQPLAAAGFYRVTISRDADGRDVVRRFLVAEPRVDLRSLSNALQPGQTYFWRVEAFTGDGQLILAGPWQGFMPGQQTSPSARERRVTPYEIASLVVPPPPGLAERIVSRSPGPGEKVTQARPAIVVEFKDKIDPTEAILVVDDTDITGLVKFTETRMSVQVVVPLANGAHEITVAVGADLDKWTFTVEVPAKKEWAAPETVPPAPAYAPGTDAEAPPPPSAAPAAAPTPPAKAPAAETDYLPEFTTQLSSNTQWISGSEPDEADTNALAVASRTTYQDGPWRFESNGSGLLSSLLNPEPRHSLGRFNDYVFRLAYDQPRWGGNLRFGIIAPALYAGSEFVTSAAPRQGVEPSLRTPAGTFSFFSNTDDQGLGGGSGVAFHQDLRGASYQAPLPEERASFRFMWLNAQDTGIPTKVAFDSFGNPTFTVDPLAVATAGDAYGGLLVVQLGGTWAWTSEYAWSYNNPNLLVLTPGGRPFGRAWRTGATGIWWSTSIGVAFRDVGPSFATPANPSLSQNSNPDRRGLDVTLSRPTPIGTLSGSYQFLQSDVRSDERPQLSLHNLRGSWTRSLTATTVLSVGANEMRTFTGELPPATLLLPPDQQRALQSDQRRLGFNASITQSVGSVTLSLGGTRDWFHDRLEEARNLINSSFLVSANWNSGSVFMLQSNFSVNWIAGEDTSIGDTRVVTLYLQPMLTWQRARLSFTPLIAVTDTETLLGSGALTADTLSTQYLGRLTWQMPGPLKFSTLSLEGGRTKTRDAILPTSVTDNRFLLIWTVLGSYNRPPGVR